MKGIMMFLVILYHSEVYYGSGHTWSWVFEPFFLSGFFFISGYLFTSNIRVVVLKTKLKQVFRTIILPYFVFVTLLGFPKIIVGSINAQQYWIDVIMLRASWFVIAIAVMQIIYAVLLSCKPLISYLIVFTIVVFLTGYVFVVLYRNPPCWLVENPWLHSDVLPNRLPACLNLALVQSPFFALGILFRHYEGMVSKYIIGGGKSLLISVLLYLIVYVWIDHTYIGSSMCVVMNTYNNIILIFLIGIIGIWALICISHKIQNVKFVNYIGKYSLLFYFLNGGVLTVVSYVIKKHNFLNPENYVCQIIVALIATLLMFPCIWLIDKYIPILAGNKESFNKFSQKLGLNIRW